MSPCSPVSPPLRHIIGFRWLIDVWKVEERRRRYRMATTWSCSKFPRETSPPRACTLYVFRARWQHDSLTKCLSPERVHMATSPRPVVNQGLSSLLFTNLALVKATTSLFLATHLLSCDGPTNTSNSSPLPNNINFYSSTEQLFRKSPHLVETHSCTRRIYTGEKGAITSINALQNRIITASRPKFLQCFSCQHAAYRT